MKITRWTLIVLAVVAVILFFNFYRLDSVPPEMVSDHAETLLDVNDVLHGWRPTYFPRNTGREMIHYYLTAAYMALFNLDVSLSEPQNGSRVHQPADFALHLPAWQGGWE